MRNIDSVGAPIEACAVYTYNATHKHELKLRIAIVDLEAQTGIALGAAVETRPYLYGVLIGREVGEINGKLIVGNGIDSAVQVYVKTAYGGQTYLNRAEVIGIRQRVVPIFGLNVKLVDRNLSAAGFPYDKAVNAFFNVNRKGSVAADLDRLDIGADVKLYRNVVQRVDDRPIGHLELTGNLVSIFLILAFRRDSAGSGSNKRIFISRLSVVINFIDYLTGSCGSVACLKNVLNVALVVILAYRDVEHYLVALGVFCRRIVGKIRGIAVGIVIGVKIQVEINFVFGHSLRLGNGNVSQKRRKVGLFSAVESPIEFLGRVGRRAGKFRRVYSGAVGINKTDAVFCGKNRAVVGRILLERNSGADSLIIDLDDVAGRIFTVEIIDRKIALIGVHGKTGHLLGRIGDGFTVVAVQSFA